MPISDSAVKKDRFKTQNVFRLRVSTVRAISVEKGLS